MPPANMTQFLTQEAFMKFRTVTWLAKRAKEIGFLSAKEPQKKFADMLERWMARYRDGKMSNGCEWQAEVYFVGHGRLKAKRPHRDGGYIGLIRVARRREDQSSVRMDKLRCSACEQVFWTTATEGCKIACPHCDFKYVFRDNEWHGGVS